jgi:tetratricopeptide (TPR) repeat protein
MKLKPALFAAMITITVTIGLLLFISACGKPAASQSVAELLSLGEKYLLELDYEQALVQFLKVIEIEPMNPRGYTGAAKAYSALDKSNEAIDILKKGFEKTGDVEILTLLEKYQSQQANGISQNQSLFPGVALMNEEQFIIVKPLVDAILAMDYEKAYDYSVSTEQLWEMCGLLYAYGRNSHREEGDISNLLYDAETYKVSLSHELASAYQEQSIAVLYILNGNKEDGIVISASISLGKYDTVTNDIRSDCMLRKYSYSNSISNGPYHIIEYQVNSDGAFGMIEEGNAVNGVKHGKSVHEFIHEPYNPERYDSSSPKQYTITFDDGYVTAIEPVTNSWNLSRDLRHTLDFSFYPFY